jgi:hypothetical protein
VNSEELKRSTYNLGPSPPTIALKHLTSLRIYVNNLERGSVEHLAEPAI